MGLGFRAVTGIGTCKKNTTLNRKNPIILLGSITQKMLSWEDRSMARSRSSSCDPPEMFRV